MGWQSSKEDRREILMAPIAPISSIVHLNIANILNQYENIKILDMGGTGKLQNYTKHKVKSVNIKSGVDCTNMTFLNNSFDVSTSIAVLEHVNNQMRFIEESIRVSKIGVIHWFPVGKVASEIEKLKNKCKNYRHPCSIPKYDFMETPINDFGGVVVPFMTCGSHLLSLMSMDILPQEKEIMEYIIKNENEYYGYFWIYKK